jgi:hypothetical protein
VVLVRREQRERAVEAVHDRAERRNEIARLAVGACDELGGDLGVGLAEELDALGDELPLQLGEVLDDAVVDHREAVSVGEVRVGVEVGRAAVRRPAGVADSRRAAAHRIRFERFAQRGELARLLAGVQAPVLIDDRDAGGVVSAVFEPREARDEDALAVPGADVSDDSTHANDPKPAIP